MKFYLTFSYNFCIINIENDNSTNVVLPDTLRKLTSTLQSTDVSFYYLCSCLSTQFLYRTVAKFKLVAPRIGCTFLFVL